ncbi:TPA: hypothetical protein ACH3X1_004447 [Trebouxia sp. C0004]
MDINARKRCGFVRSTASKDHWTSEEDAMLEGLVGLHGTKKWVWIAHILQRRTSKQCRRRWKSMQDAELKVSGTWSPEEDALLLLAHEKHGNKWIEIAKMVGGRTDNAAKNRWATICKRHPKQQQAGSTNSTPSSDSNSTHNAASDPPQDESESALQIAPLTADTATTQVEPGSVSTPPPTGVNLAFPKNKLSTAVSNQVPDAAQQGRCKSGNALPCQCQDNASSAATTGPSSRCLAHMASMPSTNSRHRAALPTAAVQSVTASPSAPVRHTVSTDSAALLGRPTGLSHSCGLPQQTHLIRIESYCPAYQPKCQSPQGRQPVQGTVQCTTAAAIESEQSPVQPAQLILQGLGQAVPQGVVKLPCNDETTPACQAGACIPADADGHGLEPTQGFFQLPSAAPLSSTACTATCLAYLAGVMDERRREKDPNVQMHIDRAWQQLHSLLAG